MLIIVDIFLKRKNRLTKYIFFAIIVLRISNKFLRGIPYPLILFIRKLKKRKDNHGLLFRDQHEALLCVDFFNFQWVFIQLLLYIVL